MEIFYMWTFWSCSQLPSRGSGGDCVLQQIVWYIKPPSFCFSRHFSICRAKPQPYGLQRSLSSAVGYLVIHRADNRSMGRTCDREGKDGKTNRNHWQNLSNFSWALIPCLNWRTRSPPSFPPISPLGCLQVPPGRNLPCFTDSNVISSWLPPLSVPVPPCRQGSTKPGETKRLFRGVVLWLSSLTYGWGKQPGYLNTLKS